MCAYIRVSTYRYRQIKQRDFAEVRKQQSESVRERKKKRGLSVSERLRDSVNEMRYMACILTSFPSQTTWLAYHFILRVMIFRLFPLGFFYPST